MKHYYYLLLFLIAGCNEGEGVFHVQSKNFGKNAVFGIYDLKTNQSLSVENISNGKQVFKMNIIDRGYAVVRISGDHLDKNYLIHLHKGNYTIDMDAREMEKYPVKSSSSKEGAEFIDYYQMEKTTGKDITDSLEKAKIAFDHSTREDVTEKGKIMSDWSAKRITAKLEAIKVFAKKYPESQNTVILLDQLGLIETEAITYAAILNSLDKEVRESKPAQKLLKEINLSRQMMEGSTIPTIEGTNPKGNPFDAAKVFKKINVIICWTTYDTKSRKVNQQLIQLYQKYKNKDVEFIGISYDKNRKWWTDVIRDDQLIWPQYSDLLGAKSPNAKAFSDQRVPYMVLTDHQGKILTTDVYIEDLDFKIKSHLQ